MKVCASCGAQLEDNAKFCAGCGTPVADAPQAGGVIPQQTAAPQTGTFPQQTAAFNQPQGGAVAKQPNPIVVKIKKNPLLAVIPLAVLIVVIVVTVIAVNASKYQKIDAEKLFYIDYQGLNHHGTVTAKLNAYSKDTYEVNNMALAAQGTLLELGMDGDEFEDKEMKNGRVVSPYFSKNPTKLKEAWTKAKDINEIVTMRSVLLRTNSKDNYLIQAKPDKEKELSNGDKVKFTVVYDADLLKDNKIKLTNTTFTVEVKNLEEGVDFDPFDEKYLTVSFEGMDGEGNVVLSTTSDRPEEVWYDCDKSYSYDLSNGDKVTVTCQPYDLQPAGDAFYFESDGKCYVVKDKKALSKEFEVTGLTGLTEVDIFDGIEFTYERGTPFLRVSGYDNDNMDKAVVENVDYIFENNENLDVGDKFTVKAYCYSSFKSLGYKAKGEPDSDGYYTKEFTVDESMPSYVTVDNGRDAYESSDLQDLIGDKETDIKTTLQDTTAGWLWDSKNVDYKGRVEKVTSMNLKDVYVGFTVKNNYSNVGDYVNRLYGLYEVKVKTDDEEESSATLYALIYMDNVISGNGKFYQSSSWDGCKIYYYGTMNDFNKEVLSKEGYNVTKCAGGSPDVPDEPEESSSKAKKESSSKADSKADSKAESKADKDDDSKAEKEDSSAADKAEDSSAADEEE